MAKLQFLKKLSPIIAQHLKEKKIKCKEKNIILNIRRDFFSLRILNKHDYYK